MTTRPLAGAGEDGLFAQSLCDRLLQNLLNFIVEYFGVERLDQIMPDALLPRISNFSFIIFHSDHDERRVF